MPETTPFSSAGKENKEGNENSLPLVPLDAVKADETTEVRRKRASGQGEGEPAFFVDGLVLSLEDKGGKIADKSVGVGRRDENGLVRGVMSHGLSWGQSSGVGVVYYTGYDKISTLFKSRPDSSAFVPAPALSPSLSPYPAMVNDGVGIDLSSAW